MTKRDVERRIDDLEGPRDTGETIPVRLGDDISSAAREELGEIRRGERPSDEMSDELATAIREADLERVGATDG
ncbi:hypothetical protein ACFQE1_07475 [Halobium palmae]|uniref:CopG family transcriptional regulator n=1 Tax=Halobium palmae TaxID=1776492 RepID=A0ABD5RXN6_9EURY